MATKVSCLLLSSKGGFVIHRAGCRHIACIPKFEINNEFKLDVETQMDVIYGIYECHIEESEGEVDSFVDDTDFAPCLKELPFGVIKSGHSFRGQPARFANV